MLKDLFRGDNRTGLTGSMRGLPQNLAWICGGLCLMVALPLVLLSGLSSRYMLEQEQHSHGSTLATIIASDLAPVMATGDLILLEVSLRQIHSRHQLAAIRVEDVEGRMLGGAGASADAGNMAYHSLISIDDNIAGEITLLLPPGATGSEIQRMNLGLVSLALLLSLFAAALAARWGQGLSSRLRAVSEKLALGDPESIDTGAGGEIEELEKAVAMLPLELLKPPAAAAGTTADYRDAGLLYIHLDSLSQHVETLDEASLLQHTELQRRLISGAAQLYGGKLTVVRQFGLLVSFSERQSAGSPAFRAVSAAWLIHLAAAEAGKGHSLRIRLSQACGISETGIGSSQDIYPDLYNQHLVDELAELTSSATGGIHLTEAVAAAGEITNRCQLRGEGPMLAGFEEPYCDLLERQRELLLKELRPA
jgi:HAMP domain-containing protein